MEGCFRTGLVIALSVGVLGGCAHRAASVEPAASAQVETEAPAPPLPVLPAPKTQQDARRALEIAFAAERVGDVELAAAQFRAVLASDFLTDAGRMNVYWQTARAHRHLADPAGERDALEGFLLAAQLVTLSEDDLARTSEAEHILIGLQRLGGTYAEARPAGQLVSR